jgi:hypothetical protein
MQVVDDLSRAVATLSEASLVPDLRRPYSKRSFGKPHSQAQLENEGNDAVSSLTAACIRQSILEMLA